MESTKPLQPKLIDEKSRKFSLRECKYQILATVIVTIGSFATGTVFGWSGTAWEGIKSKTEEEFGFKISEVKESNLAWIVSLSNLGALVAAPITGYVMDVLGRKLTILIYSFPYILGWLIMYLAYHLKLVSFLYIGRFITGACMGASLVVIPTYIKEIVDDSLRGILGTVMPLMLVNGILFTLVIGSYYHWATLTVACLAVTALLPLSFFVPETPIYLYVKNRHEKAVASIKWLYGLHSDDDAEERLITICSAELNTKEISGKKSKSWRNLFTRPVISPVMIMVFVMLFQQFGGVNAVLSYATEIFKLMGEDFITPHIGLIILGVLQVLFVIVSMMLVDRLGRRTLLIICSLIMGLCLISIGTFFHLREEGNGREKSIAWLPITSIWIYIAAYSCGVGPVPWVLASELFNPEYRAESATIMTSSYWIFGFIVAQTYELLKGWIKASGCFYVYGVFCILGMVFSIFFVIETKGKPTKEIIKHFGGSVSNGYHQNDGSGDLSDASDPTLTTPISESRSRVEFYDDTHSSEPLNAPDKSSSWQ